MPEPTARVLPPKHLAHIVLRTNNFTAMTEFYKTYLGGHATYENDNISFITYDDEHHRIAIGAMPGTCDKVHTSSGLEHIAWTYSSFQDLCTAYMQRKELGIEPEWCVNHGMTTSMYYRDPDGNKLEMQVDQMTAEEATLYMQSAEFARNPIGADVDPMVLLSRVQAGEPAEQLMKREDVGVRDMEALAERTDNDTKAMEFKKGVLEV